MENIIKKYKDKNGYVSDISGLYNQLSIIYSKSEAYSIIKTISKNNEEIIRNIKKENERKANIKRLKEKEIVLTDYISRISKKNKTEIQTTVVKDSSEINSYVSFILDNLEDDMYLSLLPNDNSKNTLLLLDKIILYFVKEINTIKYIISLDNDGNYLEKLETYNEIYKKLINYKFELNKTTSICEKNENEIYYYMNGNESYLYLDIVGNDTKYDSIKNLIDSIKSGHFKGLKYFYNNDKVKKLFEVRDLRNKTRVFFRIVGYKKYCIIGALVNKSETNSAYKNYLQIRYDRFKSEMDKISQEDKKLIKILKSDENE